MSQISTKKGRVVDVYKRQAYSVLNPEIALALRDRKLGAIAPAAPDVILSANIGCIGHLQSGTGTPVRHWIEVVDEQLARA